MFLSWQVYLGFMLFFFFQAEDGIRDVAVTGVQTCALPILNDGRMPNWNGPRQLPERRPKKGAPNRPSKRNRPGDRRPLSTPVDRRLGFGSARDGGAVPGFALGRACAGTTAEHRDRKSVV